MKITFIGGGNMAQAIIGGLVQKDFAAHDIGVVEVIEEQRTKLGSQLGVRAYASVAEAATQKGAPPPSHPPKSASVLGDLVVMAVKPQQMREAATALAPHVSGAVVLSIAAGIRLADLSRWLGGHQKLVRCMPNTPALVSAGIAGVYASPGVNADQRSGVEKVLAAVGKVVWVKDEAQLDPVTAISGSGPAYVFFFIEALEKAAIDLGLSSQDARLLAIETFVGAAKLAAGSPDAPGVLRERVTSKGGTTEAALASMNADRVAEAIGRAVRAANARAGELADQLGKG
ncbi:MAG TPA: pyrroline-5-carboxylate reductase [Burkholderiales bacterium]|nr:pyrroline-5-carboxylate reductase [Burkholderiales bacterium]